MTASLSAKLTFPLPCLTPCRYSPWYFILLRKRYVPSPCFFPFKFVYHLHTHVVAIDLPMFWPSFSVYISIYLSIYICVYLYNYISIYVAIYLALTLSLYLCIYFQCQLMFSVTAVVYLVQTIPKVVKAEFRRK